MSLKDRVDLALEYLRRLEDGTVTPDYLAEVIAGLRLRLEHGVSDTLIEVEVSTDPGVQLETELEEDLGLRPTEPEVN